MHTAVDRKSFKGMPGKKKNLRKLDMERLRAKWNNFSLNFSLNHATWLDNFINTSRNVKFLSDACHFLLLNKTVLGVTNYFDVFTALQRLSIISFPIKNTNKH